MMSESMVAEDIATETNKDTHKTTTDMLRGRVEGGKLNSFKNFKVNLVTSGEEDIPKTIEKGEDTREKQKITTNPGPVDIKFDDKLGNPTPQSHFSSVEKVTNEEVEILDENALLNKYLLSKGINPKMVSKDSKIAYAKSNEFRQWSMTHREAVEMPFDKPYEKAKGDNGVVTDKSGAKHTPMSRAKDLARQAFKKVKQETMMGKISN